VRYKAALMYVRRGMWVKQRDWTADHTMVTFQKNGTSKNDPRRELLCLLPGVAEYQERSALRALSTKTRFIVRPFATAMLALVLLTAATEGRATDPFDETVEAGLDAVLRGKFDTLADYLHARCKQKDPVAGYILGFMYEHGSLVFKDNVEAIVHYRRSADLNYGAAKLAMRALTQKIEAAKSAF